MDLINPPPEHMPKNLDEALKEIEKLRHICYEAYQLVAAAGGNEQALDNLIAAAEGKPLPHESFSATRGEWEWRECGHKADVAMLRMFKDCARGKRLTPELTGRADNAATDKLTIKATLFALRLNELLDCVRRNTFLGLVGHSTLGNIIKDFQNCAICNNTQFPQIKCAP